MASKMVFLSSFIVLILCSNTFGNTIHQQIVEPNGDPCKTSDDQLGNCTTAIPAVSPSSNVNISESHSNHVAKNYTLCGQFKRIPQKTLGGKNVELGEWPWIVAIGYRKGANSTILWRCEGALISDSWVITAAHCVQGIGSLVLTTVRVGDLNLYDEVKDGASPVDIKVSQSIVHPEYSTRPLLNDIALLHLNSSVTFTENCHPVCMLSKEEHKNDTFYNRKLAYVVGWKHSSGISSSNDSKMIQEIQVEMGDLKTCSEKYQSRGIHNLSLTDGRVLCANYSHSEACVTDPSGPLMIPIKTRFYLAGISSYGSRCANLPLVYTRVGYFINWIRTTTGIEM